MLVTTMIYRDRDFRPGAFGFPARGDFFFAARTFRSNSDFGTARRLRMMPLNRAKSGVPSNCFAVKGGGCVSPGLGSTPCLEFIGHLIFARQLLVGKSPSNNVAHRKHEAFNVGHVAVVIAKGLFVKVAEQVEWLHAHIGTVNASLE